MARRATFIKGYRESGKSVLVISGPYEFLADDPFLYGHYAEGDKKDSMPPAVDAKKALAAHNILRVDAGWLSAKAARWMQEASSGIPSGYTVIDKEPLSRIVETKAGPVGIVFFPQGPVPGKEPTPEQERAVLKAGKALSAKTALVLGISPWGYKGERDFLPKAQGIFSAILGGGEGVGFGFSVPEKTPGVLWLRPDSQGRAVNLLDILEMPARGAMPAWTENKTFSGGLEFLDDATPGDPDMLRVVGKPPADG